MQIPYLFFEGRCEEAIEFYRKALGAENKVMHSSFQIGETTVMASDGLCSGKPDFKGILLTLTVSGDGEAEKLFAALGNGGKVQMPLAKTFFSSRFGMVADRFGVSWMIIVMP